MHDVEPFSILLRPFPRVRLDIEPPNDLNWLCFWVFFPWLPVTFLAFHTVHPSSRRVECLVLY